MKGLLLALAAVASATASAQGVLLVPDWSNDRIMAFSPTDGALINANFIVDAVSLESPKSAFDSGRGTVLVTDQISDAVFEYTYGGTLLGKVAGGGVGPALDNIRGGAVKDGILYIANFGTGNGAPGRAIVKVDLANPNLFTNLATGTWDPFDVFPRENDILLSDSTGDDIFKIGYDGSNLGFFHESNGTTGINWPQQISPDFDGNILVANFSPPIGVYRYDSSTGAQLNFYPIALSTGTRGARRLANGNILFTWGTGVGVYNPATGLASAVLTGVNAQYIHFSLGFTVPISGYEVTQGTEFSGGLSSMSASDDVCLAVFNDEVSLSAQVVLNGRTPVTSPTSYAFRLESSVGRPGLSQLIELRNYDTAGWTIGDGRVATLADTVVDVVLTASSDAHVDANGDVSARISWQPINDEDPAVDGWIHCIDQAYWTIQ